MSRIRIEDLPVVENMTAEEKELIFGAGRPSFRPMLEGLENREMMDAGLGYGLQMPLAQSTGGNQLALVRQLVGETTHQVNHVVGSAMQTAQQVNHFVHSALGSAQTAYSAAHQAAIDQLFSTFGRQDMPQALPRALSQGLPQGQQQSSLAEADGAQLKSAAERLLNDHIIEGSMFKNRWILHPGGGHRTTKIDGDRIKVTFDVRYGLNPFDPTRTDVEFTFQGKNWGGVKQYDLVEAKLINWKGADLDLVKGQFNDVAKTLFRNKIGTVETQRFDENTFVNNVIRQAEVNSGARLGEFRLNKTERIDGGFRILLYTDKYQFNPEFPINIGDGVGKAQYRGLGELWLTFKYDDAQLAQGSMKLSEIRQGFHYRVPTRNFQLDYYDHKWHDTGAPRVHDQMREAKWNLGDSSSASNAVLQKAADRLGADVVQWFKGRTGNSDARFHKSGLIDGHVDLVQATPDGMRVTMFVERNVEFTGRGGIRTPGVLYQRLVFDLKYEGQVNGQHQFKLAGLQHEATSDLSEHHIFGYGLDAFGTNSNAVSAQFAQVRV